MTRRWYIDSFDYLNVSVSIKCDAKVCMPPFAMLCVCPKAQAIVEMIFLSYHANDAGFSSANSTYHSFALTFLPDSSSANASAYSSSRCFLYSLAVGGRFIFSLIKSVSVMINAQFRGYRG